MERHDKDSKGREFRLNVFAEIPENGTDHSHTKVLETVRSRDSKEITLFLPQAGEVVSMGWIPKIVYKMREDADLLEIVVSPDRGFLSGHRKEKAYPDKRYKTSEVCSRNAVSENQFKQKGDLSPDLHQPHKSDDEILYRVTFENREIQVNGFRLAKPHFDSENDVVFDYIFHNPGRKIDIAEIEAATKRTINKKLYDIVRTLGFKNELKEIFFPHVSKTAIEFVNPVTEANFRKRKLREPQA